MVKWNKSIRAKMWADMISGHIKQQEEIRFIKTITKYCVAIGGISIVFIWSIYFIFGI